MSLCNQNLILFCYNHINCQDQGYSTDLLDPTQVESKNTFSQIQWPVPSINAESVDIFLGEE